MATNTGFLAVLSIILFGSVALAQDQECLGQCQTRNYNCQLSCYLGSSYYLSRCLSYCSGVYKTCQTGCATTTTTAAPVQYTRTEIGRGSCGVVNYGGTVVCQIPSATPDMNLEVIVLRQLSYTRCVWGQTYGLANDNSYLWVTGGCAAEFSVVSVTTSTATTTASATTTTTPPPTTTSAATTTTASTTKTTAATTTTASTSTTTAATTTTASTTTTPTTTTTTTAPTTTTTTPTTTTTATTVTTTATTAKNNNLDFCGTAGGSSGFRIMGGTEAENCEFPWMVMIYNQVANTVCGGAIIDSRHVLTASHCFFTTNPRTGEPQKNAANELIVFSGSSTMPFDTASIEGLQRNYVTQIITHEQYDDRTLDNDVAILELSQEIIFDDCHKPLCMIDGTKSPQEATNCRAMGWGLASNGPDATVQSNLLWVDLPIASDSECRSLYGSLADGTTFCAGSDGKDACQGDSGGPLACKEADGKYYVYGIVSAGIDSSCGNSLGLYTKVSSFLPWIQSKI